VSGAMRGSFVKEQVRVVKFRSFQFEPIGICLPSPGTAQSNAEEGIWNMWLVTQRRLNDFWTIQRHRKIETRVSICSFNFIMHG
jgi:hypothetical protein